jgi:hypothetical protein
MLWRPFAGMIGSGTGVREVTKLGVRFGAEQSLHFRSGQRREFLRRDLTNHLMCSVSPCLPALRRGQSTQDSDSQNDANYPSLHVSPPDQVMDHEISKDTADRGVLLGPRNHVVFASAFDWDRSTNIVSPALPLPRQETPEPPGHRNKVSAGTS